MQHPGSRPVIVAGLVPAKAAVKLPPPAWFEEMRTPSAEILLAEFRQHLDGVTAGDQTDTEMPTACAPEKEAEGKSPSALRLSEWGPMALTNASRLCRGHHHYNLRCILTSQLESGILLREGAWS